MLRAPGAAVKSILFLPTIRLVDTKRLDLNLLLALEALLTERNVTKAAARLHLSQPAVSAQLSRLRDLFDDPLLVPAHRGMTPTAKALELLGPLRQSLDALRQTIHSHKDFSPAQARLTVCIACTDYVQAAVIMPLALALRRQAPGVRLALRHWNPQEMATQLSRGQVDLAITTPDPGHAHLRTRHLFTESYVLIGRQGNPRLPAVPTVEDFVALEHVIVSPSGGEFSTPIDAALAALGHRRQVVVSAASFLFVPQLIASSDLVALVPRRLLQAQPGPLAVRELPWLAERFGVGMIWHERTQGHPGHGWLRELIVQTTSGAARLGGGEHDV